MKKSNIFSAIARSASDMCHCEERQRRSNLRTEIASGTTCPRNDSSVVCHRNDSSVACPHNDVLCADVLCASQ